MRPTSGCIVFCSIEIEYSWKIEGIPCSSNSTYVANDNNLEGIVLYLASPFTSTPSKKVVVIRTMGETELFMEQGGKCASEHIKFASIASVLAIGSRLVSRDLSSYDIVQIREPRWYSQRRYFTLSRVSTPQRRTRSQQSI
jgi:hypothetical protein